jgi:hypothetical protein
MVVARVVEYVRRSMTIDVSSDGRYPRAKVWCGTSSILMMPAVTNIG